MMNNLQVIEKDNQRVLTTNQIAESFGTESKIINRNFQRNSDRYTQGKHYFALSGEELKEFKGSRQFDDNLKFTSVLYLWTEKGAWLHAKSLNTDQAWDAYEMLVDDYYSIKQNEVDLSMLSPELRALINIEKKQLEQDVRLETVEKKQDDITQILSLNPTEWRKKVNDIINKIASRRGGTVQVFQDVRNESYELLESRAKCRLSIRLNNRKRDMALEGASKSKVDKVNKMDVIASDDRLTEIYLAIVKEMAIKNGVTIKEEL
jgi:phage regulator Rha-like protein